MLHAKGFDVPMNPSYDHLTWPVPNDLLCTQVLPILPPPLSPRSGVAVAGDQRGVEVLVSPLFSRTGSTSLTATDGLWWLPNEPGRYLLTVIGHFSKGDVRFHAAIEVGRGIGPRYERFLELASRTGSRSSTALR